MKLSDWYSHWELIRNIEHNFSKTFLSGVKDEIFPAKCLWWNLFLRKCFMGVGLCFVGQNLINNQGMCRYNSIK